MRYTADFIKLSGPNKGEKYVRYFPSVEERDAAVKRHSGIAESKESLEEERIFVTIARLSRETSDAQREWKKFEFAVLERTPNPSEELRGTAFIIEELPTRSHDLRLLTKALICCNYCLL